MTKYSVLNKGKEEMKKLANAFLVLIFILSVLFINDACVMASDRQLKYDTDSIIVVYKKNISDSRKKKILTGSNMKNEEMLSKPLNIYKVQIGDKSVKNAIKDIEKQDGVLFAEPDYTYELMANTNDSLLQNTSGNKKYRRNYVNNNILNDSGESAWDYSSGEGVRVGVLDTCINMDNSDLNNVKGTFFAALKDQDFNYVDSEDVSATEEEMKLTKHQATHGIAVAGVVGAKGNNYTLGAGVAYNSDIYFAKVGRYMPLLGFNINGSDIVRGYQWAMDNGCRIINISIGSHYEIEEDTAPSSLQLLIDYAYNKKENSVLTVCGAGNEGNNEKYLREDGKTKSCYPSDYKNVYSVTAVDLEGATPRYFSFSEHNEMKNIGAPGSGYTLDYEDDTKLEYSQGTSLSAPYVCGVAALMLQNNPELSARQIREILDSTATPVTGTDREDGYGVGLINPLEAVKKSLYSVDSLKKSYTPLYGDTLKFKINCFYNNTSFSFSVKDETGNTVKTFDTFTLDKKTNNVLEWDYFDENSGSLIKSGKYTISGQIGFKSGETAFERTLTINIPDIPKISDLPKSLSVERNKFNTKTISFKVNNRSTVIADIHDAKGVTIRTLCADKDGKINLKWDLKDSKGKLVPTGKYTVHVNALNFWGEDYKDKQTTVLNVVNPGKIKYKYYKTPKKVIRAKGDTMSIKYYNTNDSYTTIKIYNSKNKLIRTLVKDKVNRKGKHTAKWNLKNDSKQYVPFGKYKIKITCTNSVGNISKTNTVKLIKEKPNCSITGLKKKYTRKGNDYPVIKVKTNQACKITVEIWDNGSRTPLKTVQGKKFFKKGTYKFKWDKRNQGGLRPGAGAFKFKIKMKNENGSKKVQTPYFELYNKK